MYQIAIYTKKEPWNKNKLVGQKRPLTLQQIWEIRVRLELNKDPKELALFNLGIDSKLRGCDLVSLRVRDIGLNRLRRQKIWWVRHCYFRSTHFHSVLI